MQYAKFFVPAKRASLGATMVTQAKWGKKAPVASNSIADRVLDLGPVGIIGVMAAVAAAGYFIVKASR